MLPARPSRERPVSAQGGLGFVSLSVGQRVPLRILYGVTSFESGKDYLLVSYHLVPTLVGRVGVEPTTLKRTDLQSAAFADSLPTQIDSNSCFKGRPPLSRGPLWWNRWDLNPQPFPCKGIALPIAPRPHVRPPFYRVAGQMPLCVTHFRLK